MTVREFVTWATGYYGPYPEGQRADVAEYLRPWAPAELDALRALMLTRCPSHAFGVNAPPDVARMDELADEARLAAERQARHERELAYAATLLPAPADSAPTEAELVDLDWRAVFAAALRRRAAAVERGDRKPDIVR